MEVVDLVVRSLVNMAVWRGWLWVLFRAFLGERINTIRGKIRDITSKGIRGTTNRNTTPIKEDTLEDGTLVNPLNNSSNNNKGNSMRLPEIHRLGIPTPEIIPNNSNSMEHPILPSPI
jgi:hypothetical protein